MVFKLPLNNLVFCSEQKRRKKAAEKAAKKAEKEAANPQPAGTKAAKDEDETDPTKFYEARSAKIAQMKTDGKSPHRICNSISFDADLALPKQVDG
jgi:hypothetical protein